MKRPEQRVYCWIRQQRYVLACHKYLYYVMGESILEDLQFDYLEKRLEVVENQWIGVSNAVTEEGYLSPSQYVDAIIHPSIERRAMWMLHIWGSNGRRTNEKIPFMSEYINAFDLYEDALKEIVRYPIGIMEVVNG